MLRSRYVRSMEPASDKVKNYVSDTNLIKIP